MKPRGAKPEPVAARKTGLLLMVLLAGIVTGFLLKGRNGNRSTAPQDPPFQTHQPASAQDGPTRESSSKLVMDEIAWRQLQLFLATPPPGQSLPEISTRVSAWLLRLRAEDFRRALELASNITRQDLKRLYLSLLMDRWPVKQRDEALSLASILPDSRSPKSVLSSLLEQRTESDWEGAARWVRKVPDPALRRRGAEIVLDALSVRDPEMAMEWSTTFSLRGGLSGLRESIFRRWLLSTPERALAWWLRPPEEIEPLEKSRLLAAAVDLESELPVAAAGKTRALAFSGRGLEAPDAVKAWTKTDGPGAWLWAATIPEFRTKENAQMAIILGWADSDIHAALKWAESRMSADSEMMQLARTFLSLLGREDFNAAVKWAERIPNQEQRSRLLLELVGILSEQSPRAAAEWLSKQTDPGLIQSGLGDVLKYWSKSDPSSAARWAESFPEGRLREEALHQVARQWSFEGPEEAITWINDLAAGAGRDKALAGYVQTIDGSRPDLAAHWALEIDSPIDREQWVIHAAGRWMQRDRQAATEWIQQTELPEEIKARLLSRERN